MKLQCVLIASPQITQQFTRYTNADALYFDDLKEFLLIQNRLDLNQSLVVWHIENSAELSMLKNIKSDLSHWIVLAPEFSKDDANLLFNSGAFSILSDTVDDNILNFHIKRLEKQVWKNLNTFDPYEGVCYLFGTKVEGLTKKEIQLLKLFMLRENYTVEKDEVVKTIWKDILVNSKTLDVHFYNLRRKLSPYGIQIKLVRRGEWQLVI